jgi:hypothetical protein
VGESCRCSWTLLRWPGEGLKRKKEVKLAGEVEVLTGEELGPSH